MDPRFLRVSPNFVLSDFLGNHSVYSKGLVNSFEEDTRKMENLTALCYEGLEPLLDAYGPMSVSYGYISPDVSNVLVKYQDPSKPSHHRFDLGAAADICLHRWIAGEFKHIDDLYLPESVVGSPVALAFAIDTGGIPYSRLITYSESPYICLAVSAEEVIRDQPRKAFYENRYQGQKKQKPEYLQYSSEVARSRAFRMLQEQGLEFPWQGAGYPTYHGGGFRQLQHTRVSKYTMVSDWLFDLKSISRGAKNVPSMQLDSVQDAFAAAGMAYDWMLEAIGIGRMSIVSGYVSHLNKFHDKDNDWRSGQISFEVVTPAIVHPDDAVDMLMPHAPNGLYVESTGETLVVRIEVDALLDEPDEVWDVSSS